MEPKKFIIKTKSSQETMKTLETMLRDEPSFHYIRFGDGEIYGMMGHDRRNHLASDGLINELSESIQIDDPNFLIGLCIDMPYEHHMSKGVFAPFFKNDILKNFLISKSLLIEGKTYESYITFHYQTIINPRWVYEIFEKYIRPKKKMFVGCTPKNVAEMLYGKIDFYINIPSKNAYDSIQEWWPKIMEHVDEVELVIPSAGVSSNIISKRLWQLNKKVQLLDVGSIVDAVEQKNTRTWIRLVGHRVNLILPKEFRKKGVQWNLSCFFKDLKYFFRKYLKR